MASNDQTITINVAANTEGFGEQMARAIRSMMRSASESRRAWQVFSQPSELTEYQFIGVDPAVLGQESKLLSMQTCPCAQCTAAREHLDKLQSGLAAGEDAELPEYERGEIVGIDLVGDPNHQREGPIMSDVWNSGDKVEVWFEDGIKEYDQKNVVGTGEFWDEDRMKQLPTDPVSSTKSAVQAAQAVIYEHPYKIHPKNR